MKNISSRMFGSCLFISFRMLPRKVSLIVSCIVPSAFNGILHQLDSAYQQMTHSLDMQRNFVADQFQGFGLVLAIAKNLVETQNGEINMDRKIGEGSALSFRFPAL